jgi:hypothetical protein
VTASQAKPTVQLADAEPAVAVNIESERQLTEQIIQDVNQKVKQIKKAMGRPVSAELSREEQAQEISE